MKNHGPTKRICVFIAWTLLAITTSISYAADLGAPAVIDRPISDEEVAALPESARESVEEVRRRRTDRDNLLNDIYSVLDRPDVPETIKRKLTFQAADLEIDNTTAIDLLVSLLRHDASPDDILILNHIVRKTGQISFRFEEPEDPIANIRFLDGLLEPVVGLPPERQTRKSLALIGAYAHRIYLLGRSIEPNVTSSSFDAAEWEKAEVVALRTRLHYAYESKGIFESVLQITQTIHNARDPETVRKPDSLGRLDDPWINLIRFAENRIEVVEGYIVATENRLK